MVLQNTLVLQYHYAMLIGYARVSTDDQDTATQVAALEAAGCKRIFREKASGGRWERPQFLRLLNQLRAGDVVVVWKLDRLSRSLRDVLTIMEQLGVAGAEFRSLTETIDTTTPAGRMMMQIVGAFAEFERAMLRERTQAGVDAARQQGRVGGRRPKLSPQQQSEIRKARQLVMPRMGCSAARRQRDMIRERTSAGLAAARKRGVAIGRPRALTPEQILVTEAMTADPAISTRQVAEQFGIHRSTLYRHLNARQKRSA